MWLLLKIWLSNNDNRSHSICKNCVRELPYYGPCGTLRLLPHQRAELTEDYCCCCCLMKLDTTYHVRSSSSISTSKNWRAGWSATSHGTKKARRRSPVENCSCALLIALCPLAVRSWNNSSDGPLSLGAAVSRNEQTANKHEFFRLCIVVVCCCWY